MNYWFLNLIRLIPAATLASIHNIKRGSASILVKLRIPVISTITANKPAMVLLITSFDCKNEAIPIKIKLKLTNVQVKLGSALPIYSPVSYTHLTLPTICSV